jgi:hypothetical protein
MSGRLRGFAPISSVSPQNRSKFDPIYHKRYELQDGSDVVFFAPHRLAAQAQMGFLFIGAGFDL